MISHKAGEHAAIALTLDGAPVVEQAPPRMLLSDFLRQACGKTEVHVGCEHGVCGACTVRVDGRPVRSCLMFAVQVAGHRVETVASLGTRDDLSMLQRQFHEHHALQCGFCTPGILSSAQAFLEEHTDPTEREVVEMLSGHLCRCTGYRAIIDAVLACARERREGIS
ncbi:(2Fe-2S)-binding protein [bacterium]|nr:MAG: (2Fe-2S)-binding protein [bacterium]